MKNDQPLTIKITENNTTKIAVPIEANIFTILLVFVSFLNKLHSMK